MDDGSDVGASVEGPSAGVIGATGETAPGPDGGTTGVETEGEAAGSLPSGGSSTSGSCDEQPKAALRSSISDLNSLRRTEGLHHENPCRFAITNRVAKLAQSVAN